MFQTYDKKLHFVEINNTFTSDQLSPADRWVWWVR